MKKFLILCVVMMLLPSLTANASTYCDAIFNNLFQTSEIKSTEISVHKPSDPTLEVSQDTRQAYTMYYLSRINDQYKRNIAKIQSNNCGNNVKNPILPNSIMADWIMNRGFFAERAENPTMILDKDVVKKFLYNKNTEGDTGCDILKMVSPEYSLILGNAIGEFKTVTITAKIEDLLKFVNQ